MTTIIDPRQSWLDYLHATGVILEPERITAFANRPMNEAQGTSDEFIRRFTAYFTLLAIDHEQEIKHIFREVGIVPGMKILDVGCGSGANGHFLLDMGVDEVIGLDAADTVLEIAGSLPKTDEVGERLHFLKHDIAEPLPFAANSFDVVLVANGESTMFADNALDEYRRVLHDGGRVVFTSTSPRKHYAWNVLIEQLMAYTFYLSMVELWGDDAFTNEDRAGWDTMLSRARAALEMSFRSYTVDRTSPFRPVTEMAVQHLFALMRGPTFKRNSDDRLKWDYLLRLHDPASPGYLFKRTDLYISNTIEFGVARIRKE